MGKPKDKKESSAQKIVSIRLSDSLLERTRARASDWGLPYQTFMKLLIEQGHAHIDEHGSLSVVVRGPDEERAYRTAQRRAELSAKRASGTEEQGTTPAPKRTRGKKRDPKSPPLDIEKIAEALGAREHFPVGSQAEGLAVYQARQEAINEANGSPEVSEQAQKSEQSSTDVASLNALVQSIRPDGSFSPYGRHGHDTLTPEDLEYFKGEPAPLKVTIPSIEIEEASEQGLADSTQVGEHADHRGPTESAHSAPQGVSDDCGPDEVEEREQAKLRAAIEQDLADERQKLDFLPDEQGRSPEPISPEQFNDFEPPSAPRPPDTCDAPKVSDEDVRAALADIEAMLTGDSSLEAEPSVTPAKALAPIEPRMTGDADLDEILALI